MGVKAFMPRLLTVGCWNIGGLYEKTNFTKNSKLEDETLINTIRKFDILCLQETHTGNDEIFAKIDKSTQ